MPERTIFDRIEELKAELDRRGIPLDSVGDLPDARYYAVGLGAKVGIDPENVLALDLTLEEAKALSVGRTDQSTEEA